MTDDLMQLATSLGDALLARQLSIAVAESCTGGLIAASLTDVPGSSAWFERGFVSYSNLAKTQMLGVAVDTLKEYGAVSTETALAMVQGALVNSEAQCAIAVTGIAGPTGGLPHKPVGTVFLAWALPNIGTYCEKANFSGDRQAVRQQTTDRALRYCLELLTREGRKVNV